MSRFRSKPVEIEAFQMTRAWLEDMLFTPKVLPKGMRFAGALSPEARTFSGLVWCSSRQGDVLASVDDWIVTEPKSDGALCYPCAPDVFALKYEPVG